MPFEAEGNLVPRQSQVDDDYFTCPHCGAELPGSASFCRECGASEDSGWEEEWTDSAESEDDFEYDEYLRREFPDQCHREQDSIPSYSLA